MTAPGSLSLPTFVAGPENEGRGYGVLAHSGSAIRAGWTVDLPMILFEWAKLERREPFVACFPVADDVLAVCRARFFRRLAIGHVSFLNGALITTAQCERIGWRTELVAAQVPPPDETLAFARQPLVIDVPAPRAGPAWSWPGLGLAWGNRIIAVEQPRDVEQVVQLALDSIDPPDQRRRVVGWTTSIELAPRGALNPLRQCQLAVIGGAAPAIEGFVPMTLRLDGTSDGVNIEPPAGRAMWMKLRQALIESAPRLTDAEPLRWRTEMTGMSPPEVATVLLRGAAGILPPAQTTRILYNLIMRGDEPLRAPGLRVLQEQLKQLAKTQPEEALDLIVQLRELLAAPGWSQVAFSLLTPFDAAAFERAPPAMLAQLVDLAGTLVATAPPSTLGRAALRPLAEIALAYTDCCEPSDPALTPLIGLIEHWPDEADDMLDNLASKRLVEAIAGRGRAALAAITKKLLRLPPAVSGRYPARTREEWVRALRAMLGAIHHLENAHD